MTNPGVPGDLSEWKNTQANLAIFRMKDNAPSEAGRLLEISDTNRVVTPDEARCLIVLRAYNRVLGHDWDWCSWLADQAECYQLTVGTPENSRRSFREVVSSEIAAEKQNKRSWWDKLFVGD